jgi:hypothetical protein
MYTPLKIDLAADQIDLVAGYLRRHVHRFVAPENTRRVFEARDAY